MYILSTYKHILMFYGEYNVCMPLCSTLLVRQGKPEDVVGDLIKQLGSVSAVAFHEEVCFRVASYRSLNWKCSLQVFLSIT